MVGGVRPVLSDDVGVCVWVCVCVCVCVRVRGWCRARRLLWPVPVPCRSADRLGDVLSVSLRSFLSAGVHSLGYPPGRPPVWRYQYRGVDHGYPLPPPSAVLAAPYSTHLYGFTVRLPHPLWSTYAFWGRGDGLLRRARIPRSCRLLLLRPCSCSPCVCVCVCWCCVCLCVWVSVSYRGLVENVW